MTTKTTRAFFTAEKIGVWLDNISHRKVRTQDGEAPMVDLDLRIEPLTPELAAEIDPEIRRSLFELSTGEPRASVGVVGFNVQVPQQNVHVYTTPDTERARLVFDRCDVSKIVARRVKGQDGFGLRFRFSFSHPTKDQHAYLSEHLYGQFFVTTEQTDPSLFEDRTPLHSARGTRSEEAQPDLVVDSDDDSGDDNSIVAGTEAAEAPASEARLPTRRHTDPRRGKGTGKGKAKPGAKKGRGRK